MGWGDTRIKRKVFSLVHGRQGMLHDFAGIIRVWNGSQGIWDLTFMWLAICLMKYKSRSSVKPITRLRVGCCRPLLSNIGKLRRLDFRPPLSLRCISFKTNKILVGSHTNAERTFVWLSEVTNETAHWRRPSSSPARRTLKERNDGSRLVFFFFGSQESAKITQVSNTKTFHV